MAWSKEIQDAIDYIRGLKTAYQLTFPKHSPAQQMVLADLARFCRATESCVVPGNHDKTLILEGRREVWLRLNEYLNLTVEDLYQLKSGRPLIQHGDENG